MTPLHFASLAEAKNTSPTRKSHLGTAQGGQDGIPPTLHDERSSGEALTLEDAKKALALIVQGTPLFCSQKRSVAMLTEANTLIYVRQPVAQQSALCTYMKALLHDRTQSAHKSRNSNILAESPPLTQPPENRAKTQKRRTASIR